MMLSDIPITAPAVLFSCSSLLSLAFTNRFMGLASLIRNLVKRYQETGEDHLRSELDNLHKRVHQIRDMQIAGMLSILFAVIAILVLLFQQQILGEICFALSLIALIWSLYLSITEIWISTTALNIELNKIHSVTASK